MNPQGSTENTQGQTRDNGCQRHGRKINCAKQDKLRAMGKCFQCEETGHNQRNCPKLHSIRRPNVNATNIESARRQRMVRVRNSQDVHVSMMRVECGLDHDDNATNPMRRAYSLCSLEWGPNDCWGSPATRVESWYSIYQVATKVGALREIMDGLQPEVGVLEVATTRFGNRECKLLHLCSPAMNTTLDCVWDGRWHLSGVQPGTHWPLEV